MPDADEGEKKAAADEDSDEEWGNWSAGGKKEGAEGDEKKAQEPAPFTRILLKGKGKGDDGGRRGGGRRLERHRDRHRDRDRHHRDRQHRGHHRGKGYSGKNGKTNGKSGYELYAEFSHLFMKQPGQVVLPKARPGQSVPPPPPPPVLPHGLTGHRPVVFQPDSLLKGRGNLPNVPNVPHVPVKVPPRVMKAVNMPSSLDQLHNQMEWRPPPLNPAGPTQLPGSGPTSVQAPLPKIRPTQKRRTFPSQTSESEAKRLRGATFATELRLWLSDLDNGKGVMLRYEEALTAYGSFEELMKLRNEDEHEWAEQIDFETQGHLLVFKNGLRKMRESRGVEEPSFTKPQPKAMPAFVQPVPKSKAQPAKQDEAETEEVHEEGMGHDWQAFEELQMEPLEEGEEGESEVDEEWQEDLPEMEGELRLEEEEWEETFVSQEHFEEDDIGMEKIWQGVLSKPQWQSWHSKSTEHTEYTEYTEQQEFPDFNEEQADEHEEIKEEDNGDEFEEVMVEEEILEAPVTPPKSAPTTPPKRPAAPPSPPSLPSPVPKSLLRPPPVVVRPPPKNNAAAAAGAPSNSGILGVAPSGYVIPKIRPAAVRPDQRQSWPPPPPRPMAVSGQ